MLAARPEGEPRDTDFRFEVGDVPVLREGEVLLRTIYLSLDPYMRGRMDARPSDAQPIGIGEVMVGATVSEVVASKSPDFNSGDIVLSYSGWQEYAVSDTKHLQRLNPEIAPVTTALGVLGMPGMTAYTGLLNIGQPKEGDTLVVAAAAGAVGSVVGQIARIKGCRAVGIAGGESKCAHVREQLGFDDCVDHRSSSFSAELREACPNGIDIYFENVGGRIFDVVLGMLNPFARVPVCGLIALYNAIEFAPRQGWAERLMATVLTKRLTLRGFIVSDFLPQSGDFFRDMVLWLREGKVHYREDVVDGLENAVGAFQRLLHGQNFGKLLVRF